MDPYVIYHGDCNDGFTAAYAFWLKYGDSATYIAGKHGEPPPEMEIDRPVFIVDFSYGKDTMVALHKRHQNLQLYDHHISAYERLKELPYCHFDMAKSGAVLAWEVCFGQTQTPPALFAYVQDRDIWQWRLPNSEAVNAYLGIQSHTFSVWSQLHQDLEERPEEIVKRGKLILDCQNFTVQTLSRKAYYSRFDGHTVPVVNASSFHSELGHQLLNDNPKAPFSIIWFINQQGHCILSFRSRGDFDVAELATKFGGGGHRAAAGCQVNDYPKPADKETDFQETI